MCEDGVDGDEDLVSASLPDGTSILWLLLSAPHGGALPVVVLEVVLGEGVVVCSGGSHAFSSMEWGY